MIRKIKEWYYTLKMIADMPWKLCTTKEKIIKAILKTLKWIGILFLIYVAFAIVVGIFIGFIAIYTMFTEFLPHDDRRY